MRDLDPENPEQIAAARDNARYVGGLQLQAKHGQRHAWVPEFLGTSACKICGQSIDANVHNTPLLEVYRHGAVFVLRGNFTHGIFHYAQECQDFIESRFPAQPVQWNI